jgi:hypothetical protein
MQSNDVCITEVWPFCSPDHEGLQLPGPDAYGLLQIWLTKLSFFVIQAAGIADRLKARNIGFAISDAALDVVVKVRRDISFLLWPAKPE